jgi:broad specificity phosphatase PhoE
MKTKFVIIRHGQSEGNLSNTFAGRTDVPLTPLGLKQGECTAEFLKNEKIDVFYSSELSRAYITTLLAAEKHGMQVTKNQGFNEISGGKWEGMPYATIKEVYSDEYNKWITNIGTTQCPEGESVTDVCNRVYKAYEDVAKKHMGQTVCVGSHGMAIRAFILRVLDLPVEKMHTELSWVTNASVTYVEYEDGKFTLKEYGHDAHLEAKGMKTELRAKA